MFVRLIFYDKLTGKQRMGVMMQGHCVPQSTEEMAAAYSVAYEDCGVLRWDVPDPDVEAAFSGSAHNHVFVAQAGEQAGDAVAAGENTGSIMRLIGATNADGQMVEVAFAHIDYPEPPPQQDEAADMLAALALLGVEPGEEVPDGQVG